MNDLNTQQIVLLCLLVSFVTAIATGITTVSLVDQSPKPVSQTINRIVERTVETIVETPEDKTKPVIERVVETVVVNQEDLTVEAVEKSSKSLARIYGLDRTGNRFFVGLGIVVGSNGKTISSSNVAQLASSFEADYAEGTFKLDIVGEATSGIVTFQPTETGDKTFVATSFGDSQSLKLAQTVIVLSGRASNVVATGIITGLVTSAGEVATADVTADTVPKEVLTQIDTSIDQSIVLPGSILMNLKGDIVGMKTGQQVILNSFAPSNAIKLLIAS